MAGVPPERRVLSIQSQVVSGYVGNKCAVFPLQLLGFDVDPINTVQFANHSGYPTFRGERATGAQVLALLEGLTESGLLNHSHLLTGYIGSAEVLRAVVSVLADLKAHRPDLVYVCDPVLGDNGQLYLPSEVVGIYRDEVLQHATIATPNQFEAELLSGIPIACMADAVKVVRWFHAKGVPNVVVTSVEFPSDPATLVLVGSTHSPEGGQPSVFAINFPKLDGSFTGTGDTMAALVLGWSASEPTFRRACELALSGTQAILAGTQAHHLTLVPAGGEQPCKTRLLATRELRLVQARKEIECPSTTFTSYDVATE